MSNKKLFWRNLQDLSSFFSNLSSIAAIYDVYFKQAKRKELYIMKKQIILFINNLMTFYADYFKYGFNHI